VFTILYPEIKMHANAKKWDGQLGKKWKGRIGKGLGKREIQPPAPSPTHQTRYNVSTKFGF